MESSKLKNSIAKWKVLQLTQKNLAIAGIDRDLAAQSYPFNAKIVFSSLTIGLAIVFGLIYVFYEAKTFVEYTQCIFMSSVAGICSFALLILILKVKKLFGFIDGCDGIANTREWKCIISTHCLFQMFSSLNSFQL